MFLRVLFWQVVGCVACVLWALEKDTKGWELCNPIWAYRYHKSVNWFGAIVLSLFYTTLCPLGAAVYWFYKVCTVGRK